MWTTPTTSPSMPCCPRGRRCPSGRESPRFPQEALPLWKLGRVSDPCLWPEKIPHDHQNTSTQQQPQDEQGTVSEKLLGEDEDDGVGGRVKEPVVLAGEEQLMED